MGRKYLRKIFPEFLALPVAPYKGRTGSGNPWALTAWLLALCGLLAGCESSDRTEAVYLALDLRTVYRAWTRDGRPPAPDISNYVRNKDVQYFVYTNVVEIGTNTFHCQFGLRSMLFRRRGILAITDEQVVLWVPDYDKKVVVSPETKRWFDH